MLKKIKEMNKKTLVIVGVFSAIALFLFFKMIISLIPIIVVAALGIIGYKLYKKGY